MATKNEVVVEEKKPLTFSETLTNALESEKGGLPKNFNMQRFVHNSIALLNENEQLSAFAKNYGTSQIKSGLMRGAYLDLDAMNSEFYLVPYSSKLNFMLSYKGCMKLAKKYSIRPIKDVFAEIVRMGDEFSKEIVDGETNVVFKPKAFNDGDIIGAFAMVVFEDGSVQCETMTVKDLEKTRSKSKAKNSMAWVDFTGEMYKKTVVHRLFKTIELDFESLKQKELFNDDMAIDTTEDKPEVVDPFEAEETVIETEFVEGE